MKKSLLALVALTAFAGAASAQSSVKIFGKLDQSIGKNLGTKNKEVMDNAGSRIAFSGYEDLGGGMGALFAFEHRFFPDTGNAASNGVVTAANGQAISATNPAAVSTQTFWNGFSYVGLKAGAAGTVTLGRHYTAAFQNVQTMVDPFAGEGVGALREIASGALYGSARVRVANSIKYSNTFGPVTVAADLAEKSATATATASKPYSVAVSGVFGPAWVGLAYENPETTDSDVVNLGARVTFGPATIMGELSSGKGARATGVATPPAVLVDFAAYLIGAKVAVGSGDIKVGYAARKDKVTSAVPAGTSYSQGVTTTQTSKIALGYDHNLSKRTKVYVQYARDGKLAADKTGYEVGMQHNF